MIRSGIWASLAVALTILIHGAASAQQDFSAVEIDTVQVTDNIYALFGAGGNIGVWIGEDGIFIIDDQYAPLTDKILAAIAKLDSRSVSFVLNTHWHFDHTGGNENLGRKGVLIIAHDNVHERMSSDQSMPAFNREIPAAPLVARPDITFNDHMTLHLNGEHVEVIHVENAHTDGDSVVHFPDSNVIHAGDTYFNRRFPFIDISSGGSIDGMVESAVMVLSMADDDTQIIPGHGPMSNRAELLEYRTMLSTMRDRAREAVREGLSADEFVETSPATDYEEAIPADPTSFLRVLHADVSRNQ